MDFGLWENYYKKILDDFGFEREDDEKTAQVLDDLLFEQSCLTLEDLYEKVDFSTKFIIFGAGPSWNKEVFCFPFPVNSNTFSVGFSHHFPSL